MEPRRLIIAALLLAGLAGGLWWSNRQQDNPDQKKTGPDDAPKIVEIPQDQIVKIEIRRASAEPVVLEKGANWSIKAPKTLNADQDAVSSLVGTLAVLNSERLIEEKTADFKPYGLETPILTLVVTRKDGKSHTIQIGDDAPSGSAAYARMAGESKLYTIASFTRSALEKTWQDLRDKRLMHVDGDKITRVEVVSKGASIEFGKNAANNWAILKPRPLRADNFAVEELVRKLKDARMEVSNDSEEIASWPAKFAAAAPAGVGRLIDQKGVHQIEIRKGKENDYYAKSSSVEGVFRTSAETGEALTKTLDDFRNKKLFEFAFNEPERVEVKYEPVSHVFTKSGTEWKKDGKVVDPAGVQQIIDRLRDLSATRFADAATGTGIGELAVALPGNKGAERITVTKQGDAHYGRRAGESEVFVLDGKTLTEIRDLAAAAKEPAPAAKPAEKK